MFKDRVAVVTGASSGIGKAIALQLAAQGAKLYLLGRNLATLAAVAENIQTDVKICQVDLTKSDEIRQLQTIAVQVDLLIHSAGVISLGELQTAPIEDLDWQYQTNVRAPYLLTQTLLPLMIPVKGQIVFINSTGGLNSRGGMGQYSATKHALKAIADSLRDEVNSLGMRVLSVYPGRTASPMQAAVYKKEGRVYNPDRLLQPQDVADVVLNALNLPYTAEVTDISVRPLVKG
jgi:NADP-dependent 3-hydroxy acid dehydrogenase YdfG